MTDIVNSADYVIDTSSILSQKDDRRYRLNVWPTLWNKISDLVTEKRIITCSEIFEEVQDDLPKKWYNDLNGFVLPINNEIQKKVVEVVTSNPQMINFKQIKSSGDAFLIATAMEYNLTVITEENKDSSKKIPQVCKNLNIPCIDILGLCVREGWHF